MRPITRYGVREVALQDILPPPVPAPSKCETPSCRGLGNRIVGVLGLCDCCISVQVVRSWRAA